MTRQRQRLDHVHLQHVPEGEAERHPGTGDRSTARAAIGIQDVAIQSHGHLAHLRAVDHGAQRAADQRSIFLRTARTAYPRAASRSPRV